MTNENARSANGEIPSERKNGAIFRIFGVILIILGTLDVMLSWRGAFDIVPFHATLIAVGLLLCLIGAIRRQYRV